MNRALALSLVVHLFLITLFVNNTLPDFVENQAPTSRMQARLSESLRGFDKSLVTNTSFERVQQPSILSPSTPKNLLARPAPSVPRPSSQHETSVITEKLMSDQAPVTKQEEMGDTQKATQAIAVKTVSLDGVRQYHVNLAREARNYKRFPALARQRGWEGEVSIVVSTVAGVVMPQVSLNQGSGIEVLDKAALEMVRLAVQSATMPEVLRGQEFALTLPIRFTLED